MSKPTKMTLLLTAPERARLDALRLARGDRSAAATLRALVRDAGGDPPRAAAPTVPYAQLYSVNGRPCRTQPCRLKHVHELRREYTTLLDQCGSEDGEALAVDIVERDGREVLRHALGGIMPAWSAKAREDAKARAVPLHLQAAYMLAHTEAARRVLDGLDTHRTAAQPVPAPEPDDPGMPEPVDLDVPAARADFLARVGCSPEEYLRRWRAGQIPDTGEGMFRYQRALLLEDTPEDDGADAFLEAIHGAAAAAIEAELGHCLPQRPVAAAELAELVVQALPRWAGLDPGGDPPELDREQASRPAESFKRADMVRTLLLEALDARAGRTGAKGGA